MNGLVLTVQRGLRRRAAAEYTPHPPETKPTAMRDRHYKNHCCNCSNLQQTPKLRCLVLSYGALKLFRVEGHNIHARRRFDRVRLRVDAGPKQAHSSQSAKTSQLCPPESNTTLHRQCCGNWQDFRAQCI